MRVTVRRPTYTRRDPETGRKVRRRANYHYAFWAENGVRRSKKLFRDRAASEHAAAEMQLKVERAAAGLADPYAEHRGRPLADHAADYLAVCRARGDDPATVARKALHLGRLGAAGVRAWRDATRSRVLLALGRLPVGAGTRNQHLASAKALLNWMVEDGRAPHNPLAKVPRFNAEADPRHPRRALGPGDWSRLLAATRAGPDRYHIAGPDRELLYTVAAYTGLRAHELAHFTPARFRRGPAGYLVEAEARRAKNRRRVDLPLRDDLAARLDARLAGLGPADRLWPGTWWTHGHAARMLRKDLAAAGIPYRDAAGRVCDFHALRGQFVTNLALAGVPLVVAQQLARHSDPKLTANVYTRLGLADLHAAVATLPPVGPDAPPDAPQSGTGREKVGRSGTAKRRRAA